MEVPIEPVQQGRGRGLEGLRIVPEAMIRHVLFEEAPDRFDHVEVRMVARHPRGRRPPVLLRTPVLHHRRAVLADIVHHQYEVPCRHVAAISLRKAALCAQCLSGTFRWIDFQEAQSRNGTLSVSDPQP